MTKVLHRIFGALRGKSAGGVASWGSAAGILAAAEGGRDEMTRPYAQSVWVSAALKLVTQPIKSVPLRIYDNGRESGNAGLVDWWREPAAGLTYEEFVDATCGWYKLAGEFFWLLDDTWLMAGARRSRLLVARPDAMRGLVTGGMLHGWEYRDAAGVRHALIPEQVVHVKQWNPYHPFRGLGDLEAARIAAETDHLAGKFTRDSYANAGEMGDYIMAKGEPPTAEQQMQVMAALRAKRAAKARGDFRPVFLSGDFEVKSPQVTAPDVALVANRLQSRHEVFIAFGVPASMADVAVSYSIGSASDYFRLIHSTCIPLSVTVAGAITRLLRRQGGNGLSAFFDFDEHPTMQAVRNERVDTAHKLWGTGMPMKLVNDYLDMGLPAFFGWGQGYVSYNLQAVGNPVADPEPPKESKGADGRVDAMVKALGGEAVGRDVTGGTPVPPGKAAGGAWERHWAARQPGIKMYEGKFNRVLMAARSEVLRKIEGAKVGSRSDVTGGTPVPPGQRGAGVSFLFDLANFAGALLLEFNKAARVTLDVAGRQMLEEMEAEDDAWTMPPVAVREHLRKRENFIKDISDSVFREIERTLEEGVEAGETMDELAERVRAAFNGISKARAKTIASTEVAAAYGYSRQLAMEQAGVEWKEWLSSGNDNVRPSHQVAHGQVRRVAEPFDVGGARLMGPADGSLGAPPEEIINCHCVAVATEGPTT